MTRRASILALAVLLASTSASAQCPDGGAPPCRAGSRVVTVDPNRIVLFPFRVTAADTLLGEGFAELLAPEFTGVGGPRSIQMSTTLNAWRRAGGGLRTPLTNEAARQLARSLGAGVLCEGSVVGIGGRLTVNAALIDATSGRQIGTPARVTGTVDSIETLLNQVATALLGTGGRDRAAEAGRLTKSPAALRSYFEGLTLWRRADRRAEAAAAFEAAFAADTTFALAAFQRWLVAYLLAGSSEWQARLIATIDRLPAREQIVAYGALGQVPGAPRSRKQISEDRRRAAERLVDSPEAWYLYADDIYHNGMPVVGPDSLISIAKDAFQRAAVDSQAISMGHLLSIAMHTRDSALTRQLARAFARFEGEDSWSREWIVAAALNDAPTLARLRQRGPSRYSSEFSGLALLSALDTRATMASIAEGYRQLYGVVGDVERRRLDGQIWFIHRARGQPSAAAQSIQGKNFSPWSFQVAGSGWVHFTGDVADDTMFMRMFGASLVTPRAAEQRRQCVIARLAVQTGNAERADSTPPALVGQRCSRVLEIWRSFNGGTLTSAELTELDSIATAVTIGTFMGFEHRLLSRVYEARGDTARAVRAIKLYPRDFTGMWLPPAYREEGRVYLIAGDTVNAIRSWNRFLELRTEAEPAYVAERDSVRALVSALARRR